MVVMMMMATAMVLIGDENDGGNEDDDNGVVAVAVAVAANVMNDSLIVTMKQKWRHTFLTEIPLLLLYHRDHYCYCPTSLSMLLRLWQIRTFRLSACSSSDQSAKEYVCRNNRW